MERALVIIKPDGIQKGLVGEIFSRIKREKLRIVKIKTILLMKKQVNALYQDSLKKFPQIKNAIISYMTSGDSIIFIVEGKNAIRKVRAIRGSSDPSKSQGLFETKLFFGK